MEEAVPAGERGCMRTLHLLLNFALNLKLLQKTESILKRKKTLIISITSIWINIKHYRDILYSFFIINFWKTSMSFTFISFLIHINHISSAQKPRMAGGAHTGQLQSRAVAALGHSGHLLEEKVCFLRKRSFQTSLSIFLPPRLLPLSPSHSGASSLWAPAQASPHIVLLLRLLSKRETWNAKE